MYLFRIKSYSGIQKIKINLSDVHVVLNYKLSK